MTLTVREICTVKISGIHATDITAKYYTGKNINPKEIAEAQENVYKKHKNGITLIEFMRLRDDILLSYNGKSMEDVFY